MRKNFDSQSRHVINATFRLGGISFVISTAGSLRSRGAADLSNFLTGEAGGGLCRSQRNARKRRDAVDFIISFISLEI